MLSTCKAGVERASTRLPFLRYNPVLPQTNATELHISSHLCLALRTSLGCFPWFCSTKAKLLSIYRCSKSKAGFNGNAVKHTGFTCMARLTRLARITRLTSFTRFTGRTRNPRLTSPTSPICLLKTTMLCCRPSLQTCQPLCCCLRDVFFCSACSIRFCSLHAGRLSPWWFGLRACSIRFCSLHAGRLSPWLFGLRACSIGFCSLHIGARYEQCQVCLALLIVINARVR